MRSDASWRLGLVCGLMLALAGCEDDPTDGQDLFGRDASAGTGTEAGTGSAAGTDAGAAGSGSTDDAGSDDAGSDDAG
jgi:hypothetical protein